MFGVNVFTTCTKCKYYDFETKKISDFESCDIKISSYLLAGGIETLKYIINKFNKSNHVYIMGIQYSKGDIQVAITGKKHINESPIDAISRELSEETGLMLHETKSHDLYHFDFKNTNNYVIAASLLQSYKQTDDTEQETKDDPSRKVQIFIHGSFDDYLLLFNDINKRKLSFDTHSIVGLVLFSITDITNYYYKYLC